MIIYESQQKISLNYVYVKVETFECSKKAAPIPRAFHFNIAVYLLFQIELNFIRDTSTTEGNVSLLDTYKV